MTGETTAKAIVAYGQNDWRLENLTVREIKDDELLVQMVSSGICHTDVIGAGAIYPRVLGHEGAGYVKKVGSQVTVARVGDPGLLSFASCRACRKCATGHPAYCATFGLLNIMSNSHDYTHSNGTTIAGKYFGQSSFSSMSIVGESSVVNVKDIIKDAEELKLFAPLGCGLQTGSGAITRVAKAQMDDLVAIIGLGGVGLGALMAAKLVGCKTIIAIDIIETRLELARSLGATHTINSRKLDSGKTLVDMVKEATDGQGTSICVDTTGIPAVMEQALEFTGKTGKVCQIGASPPGTKLSLDLLTHLSFGKQFMGIIEGDSVPAMSVPEMIGWYREGMFPFNQFVKFFNAEDFKQAVAEMHSGETVKPILVW